MDVCDAAQAVNEELLHLAWNVADDTLRSAAEVEELVEQMAHRIVEDR